MKPPHWKDQKRSLESGCEAMKGSIELVEAVEESQDQSQIHQKDIQMSHHRFACHHHFNGDHSSSPIRAINNPQPSLTEMVGSQEDSPIFKQRRLEAEAQMLIAKREEKLEEILLEEERVRARSVIIMQQYEAMKQEMIAELDILRDQIRSHKQRIFHLENDIQEQREKYKAEIKLVEKKLEAKEKEHEQKTLESEVEILDQMKIYLKIQVKKEKMQCLLAEAKLSLAKEENPVAKTKCDIAEAN